MKKSRTHLAAGFTRGALLVALSLGLSVAAANAAQNVTIPLVGKSFGVAQNGDSINLSADSTGTVDAAHAYYYRITGTCHGNGAYSQFVPPGTDIKDLINQIKTGAAKSLTGTKQNPSGVLPVNSIYDKTYTGDIDGGFFTAHLELTLFAKISASGVVTFEVKDVTVTANGSSQAGTIEFEEGAKIAVGVAPKIAMDVATRTVGEGVGKFALKVVRTGNLGVACSIHFQTGAGTATKGDSVHEGGDFVGKGGTVAFAVGEDSKTVMIAIKEDAINEDAETFSVNLTSPIAAIRGKPGKTVVTITDND